MTLTIPLSLQQALFPLLAYLGQAGISAVVGTSVSRILAQDGFPKLVNAIIAYIVLLVMATANAYVTFSNLHFAGGVNAFAGLLVGAITLLLSGALASLKPYLLYLNFLESHIFNVVHSPMTATTVKRLVVSAPATPAIAQGLSSSPPSSFATANAMQQAALQLGGTATNTPGIYAASPGAYQGQGTQTIVPQSKVPGWNAVSGTGNEG